MKLGRDTNIWEKPFTWQLQFKPVYLYKKMPAQIEVRLKTIKYDIYTFKNLRYLKEMNDFKTKSLLLRIDKKVNYTLLMGEFDNTDIRQKNWKWNKKGLNSHAEWSEETKF